MRQSNGKPLCFERDLNIVSKASFNGKNPWRHVEARVGHDDSVQLIEDVF